MSMAITDELIDCVAKALYGHFHENFVFSSGTPWEAASAGDRSLYRTRAVVALTSAQGYERENEALRAAAAAQRTANTFCDSPPSVETL